MQPTIALIHNFYRQPGGEDRVFASDGELLEERGHRVIRYSAHNDSATTLEAARRALWSRTSYRELRSLFRSHRPAVAHFFNTFPLISPAGYDAAAAEGVAVVQALQNFRLLCPNGLLSRDGRPCEDCVGRRIPWPGIAHACYRDSRLATLVPVSMLAAHRARGTWKNSVTLYIAATEFARDKFIEGGLPAERIVVKPNVVHPDAGPGEGNGGYVLYVGRLAPEKGIETLLAGWAKLRSAATLKIAGDGPLRPLVLDAMRRQRKVEWLGPQPQDAALRLMQAAAVLVCPSVCYEGFGMVVAQAFAAGTPVIASDLGSLRELVDHGRTGLRFRPGSADDLAEKVGWILARPEMRARMRREARAEFEAKYGAERNYRRLLEIYEMACEMQNSRAGAFAWSSAGSSASASTPRPTSR